MKTLTIEQNRLVCLRLDLTRFNQVVVAEEARAKPVDRQISFLKYRLVVAIRVISAAPHVAVSEVDIVHHGAHHVVPRLAELNSEYPSTRLQHATGLSQDLRIFLSRRTRHHNRIERVPRVGNRVRVSNDKVDRHVVEHVAAVLAV